MSGSNFWKMAEDEFPDLKSESENKLILRETIMQNQEIVLHSELASKFYDVLRFDKQINDGMRNESGELVAEEPSSNCLSKSDVKNSRFYNTQDINYLPESVSSISESINPVTHIEIIKSGSRRVTGANRVVPLLTNALKNGKLAVNGSKLAEVYKHFLSELGSSDSNNMCMICHEVLLSCTELGHHVRNTHAVDIAADECFVCRKKYIFVDQLRIHLSQTHSITCPDLICKICFMEFGTTIEQKAHERKHDETHSCHTCAKKFSSDYLYQKHINLHTFQAKPSECEKCNKRFMNEIVLNIHKKCHLNVICSICNIPFQNDTALLLHIKEHKTDDIMIFIKNAEKRDDEEFQLEEMLTVYNKLIMKTEINTIKDLEGEGEENGIMDCVNAMISTVVRSGDCDDRSKKGAECRICGKNFNTDHELLDHRKKFHLRNRTCPFCSKRNKSVSLTWRHIHSHFKSKIKISKLPGDNPIALSQSESYIDSNGISSTKNKQVQKNSRLFSCSICSRKFLYLGSRDNHVLQHCKDKCDNWKCTVCGQVFSHPGLLLTHASSHELSFNCQICDKPFLSQKALEVHVKIHFDGTKKKVFKCKLCPIVCSTLPGLQAHHRCHTGERPFTCTQCHRKFKRRHALTRHVQVVHNSASLQYHSCSHCPREFNSSENLIRHYLRVHCQVRRFICGVCGSRFSQNQDLRRHFKVSHETELPNINGSNRKTLREIYVIPDISKDAETNPHALKIKAIVAEEKAKFNLLSELIISKAINEEDPSVKSVLQLIDNIPLEGDDQTDDKLQACEETEIAECDQLGISSPECTEKEAVSKEQCNSRNSFNNIPNINNNSEGKLYLCEHCNKNFPDENEYMEHIANRSETCAICNFCGSIFCDKVILDAHLVSEHKILQYYNSINDKSSKENFMKHILTVDDISVVPITNISDELQPVNCLDEPSAFIGQQADSNVSADTSFTISDGNGTTVISKCPIPVTNNLEINNVATTVNINGFILQNVIVQQSPTMIQSVPHCFQNEEIVNSVTSMPRAVTYQSSPVARDTYFSASDIHRINESDCMNSASTIIDIENIPGSVNADTSSSSIVINDDNELMENKPNGKEENINTSQDTKEKNDVDEVIISDHDKEKSVGCVETKRLKCTYCEDEFANTSSLKRHLKVHGDSKQYVCPDCGKRFFERCNMKTHLMTHTGERPYRCEGCGMQLRYRKDVMDHKRMHLGEKHFACEECGRKFIRQRELNRHKVTHTGEKKYKCPICGKCFGRLDQLKLGHLPIHNSQPKHSCKVCDKSFHQKAKLKQHELLHSGVKQYKCELCKKSFATDPYLRAHMQCHKKQRDYIQCPKCSRRFMNEATLQVHVRTFHGRHQKKALKQSEGVNDKKFTNEEDSFLPSESLEMERSADIEIHDVDLSILDTSNCNTVIYLQMTSEDLKFPLSGVDS